MPDLCQRVADLDVLADLGRRKNNKLRVINSGRGTDSVPSMRRPAVVKNKYEFDRSGRMDGSDQREAHPRGHAIACHFLLPGIRLGWRPGPVQAERSEPQASLDGWPRSI